MSWNPFETAAINGINKYPQRQDINNSTVRAGNVISLCQKRVEFAQRASQNGKKDASL